MMFEQINNFLVGLVPPRPPVVQQMEERAERTGFPIIGPAAGHFCYQLARITGARRVFELGSGYGYSTAWFARAVQENGGGIVYHTVWDEALSREAREHLGALGYEHIIRYQVREAIEALRQTPGPFDLIFSDINKDCYVESLPVIAEKLRPGGVLIVDNVLWHGRIFDDRDQDETTATIREFTRLLTTDPAWVTTLAPIRDGLLVAWRTP